jgi:hypothetical protein
MLGFSWADGLLKFTEDYKTNFNVHKYRSALFYLNYSARQMRGMSGDVGHLLLRKMTRMQKKLKKLDDYPNDQNFL